MNALQYPRRTLAIIIPLLLSVEVGATTSINAVGPVEGRIPVLIDWPGDLPVGPLSRDTVYSVTMKAQELDLDEVSFRLIICPNSIDLDCPGYNATGASVNPLTKIAQASVNFSLPSTWPGGVYYLRARASTTRGYPDSTKYTPWTAGGDIIERVFLGSAPTATNLAISGELNVNKTLALTFTYDDADGDVAGTHAYQWYRSGSASGTPSTPITGATGHQYTATSADADKYLVARVTPKSATGVPDTGSAVSKVSGQISLCSNTLPSGLTFTTPDNTQDSWGYANNYCASLGGGARLPTEDELLALYAQCKSGKVSDVLGWPVNTYFWSSTTDLAGNNHAVSLKTGWSQAYGATGIHHVTCVR